MADGAEFVLEGNRLVVRGELGPEDEKRYSEKLFELLKTGEARMELDLTGLSEISSAYVGSTCLLALVANQRRRKVCVVANPAIGRVLALAGFDQIAEVKIVSG